MKNNFWSNGVIRLRHPIKSDAIIWVEESKDTLSGMLFNSKIMPELSLSTAEKFAAKHSHIISGTTSIFFSIENSDENLVGDINLHNIKYNHGTFESGTRIFKKYRNLGYATQAKKILLNYAFGELRLKKYNTRCLQSNQAIISHLKKFGCTLEGTVRNNIFLNGTFHDECLFGMTHEEYKEKHLQS